MDDGHWLETSIEEAKEHAEKALYNQTLVIKYYLYIILARRRDKIQARKGFRELL